MGVTVSLPGVTNYRPSGVFSIPVGPDRTLCRYLDKLSDPQMNEWLTLIHTSWAREVTIEFHLYVSHNKDWKRYIHLLWFSFMLVFSTIYRPN